MRLFHKKSQTVERHNAFAFVALYLVVVAPDCGLKMGRVAEWFKAAVLKTAVLERVP